MSGAARSTTSRGPREVLERLDVGGTVNHELGGRAGHTGDVAVRIWVLGTVELDTAVGEPALHWWPRIRGCSACS
jgi:hypothetical protein